MRQGNTLRSSERTINKFTPESPSGIKRVVQRTISNSLESFRSEYEYEIEYEYDFGISNQSRSQSRRFSLLLISRGVGFRNNIGVLCDDLEPVCTLGLKSRSRTQSRTRTPI